MEGHVRLDREFSPIQKSEEESESWEFLSAWGHAEPITWKGLEEQFRCVILAEAGSGKTEEFRQRASSLVERGKAAFFLRIEDIEHDFETAFEIGIEAQFYTWLQSTDEAWFFLDSVDEARLEHPRAFERALRRFAKSVANGAHRAHIYISSRPYAWRPKDDSLLVNKLLYLPAPQKGNAEDDKQAPQQSALSIFNMRPLDEQRIRKFCIAREITNIDGLIRDISRGELWALAERPFDLEGILDKWSEDHALGGRLALLRHSIDKRLRDAHNTDRSQRQPLNLGQAKEGARRLAAAVVLSGKAGLNVPDSTPLKPGIDAEAVLADWKPEDVRALLERGIFNDIIYGAVRFRHREVRELLAAEWFDGLLKSGNNRRSIEEYFFREWYGQKIVTPRMREILPWLILFDDEIRRKALHTQPEIAVEGGDPSQLPLEERRCILVDIVDRIASDQDDRSARNNSAIARIANSDLSVEIQKLINTYRDNDDAIFFLSRLVWQGEITNCAASLVPIALDSYRGLYARIASARAVVTSGSVEQTLGLWQQLNDSDNLIPRELLAELINEAAADSESIERLMVSLGKLPPYEMYNTTGLEGALHRFVDGLPIEDDQLAITRFIKGLYAYLEKPPYTENRECHVSQEYVWLLGPASHAVERLVAAKSEAALDEIIFSVMLMVTTLRHWHPENYSEYETKLHELVPAWPELNDSFYWFSIEKARVVQAERTGEPLTSDWAAAWPGPFWKFDVDGYSRLLNFIGSRTLHDDRAVALSTAHRVYMASDRPADLLDQLQNAISDNSLLKSQLDLMLNPPVSENMKEYEEKHAESLRKRQEEKEERKLQRASWVVDLRASPETVRTPPEVESGLIINNQLWLMLELHNSGSAPGRSKYANWQALIPDFGQCVAQEYRHASLSHWRRFIPPLRSEGGKPNGKSWSLIFAMAGLEIEADEITEFPANLTIAEARLALRYLTWQSNGFPFWFERMYQTFPELVEDAVSVELLWELNHTNSNEPMHYILFDLVYHAPWLHTRIAPLILKWIESGPSNLATIRHHCIHILINSGIDAARLAELATHQIAHTTDLNSTAWWFAVRVDCTPEIAIPELEQWLSGLDENAATIAAQVFVTTLMGRSRSGEGGPKFGHYQTVENLKALYVLAHRYIRTEDDINRADGGVYSPELRDDAQDARGGLFKLLSEIPGKATYQFIKQMSHEHPDPNRRPWMEKLALKRAEEDGDLEPWSAEQVNEFDKNQTMSPATHRQLFDLALFRLKDLKAWLERGNDSPWKTWKKAESETEMRTLIANWIRHYGREDYSTAQEPELANGQRMDITLQNTNVLSPVPIELKLLDKKWTGPKLCERLRNQLVGDYLREESAGHGVMLLVWQGKVAKQRWKINGRMAGLYELANALKDYWNEISLDYPGVKEIEVIVIDLTVREHVSNS